MASILRAAEPAGAPDATHRLLAATCRRWGRHRYGLAAVLGGVVALAAIGAVAWVHLQGALVDMERARQAMGDADAAAAEGDVAALSEALVDANRHLAAARGTLTSSPPIRLLGVVPGASQNLRVARAVVDRAFVLSEVAREVTEDIAVPVIEEGVVVGGGIDADELARVREATSRARSLLEERGSLDTASSWMLLGRIEGAAAEAKEVERRFTDAVVALDDGVRLLAEVTGSNGPRRYLVAAANAAEMRGAGGMILSYAVIESDRGAIRLDAVAPEENLLEMLEEPVGVPLPADYALRYESLRPTEDVRNATLTADFTVAGPVVAAIYSHATGREVDGVIQVDSMALADLLDVVGPVQIDDLGTVTADNVVALTTNETYFRFPSVADRQDVLADVAAEVFDKLLAGSFDPLEMLGTLSAAGRGRHLMVYSSADELQSGVERLGLAGGLESDTDLFHLAVQNFSGNKLDYYVDTALELTGEIPEAGSGRIDATITIANNAPPLDEPRYVFGPYDESLRAGLYRAHGVLYLPPGTVLTRATTGRGVSQVTPGTEGGRPVVTFAAEVDAGQQAEVTLELETAARASACPALSLLPSPRLRPTVADVAIDTPDGSMTYQGALDATERLTVPC